MVASVVLFALQFAVDELLRVRLIPRQMSEFAVTYSRSSEASYLPGLLVMLVAIPFLVAFVGLFRFRPWARTLSLVNVGLIVLAWMTSEFILRTGVGYGVSYLGTLLWGAVLALAFFSPLSHLFEGK